MGTTGAIWYRRGPLELKGVGVQMDGGPESLGVLAVEQRLRLERLEERHELSRSEALDLLWGETVGGHFESTIWDADWNYVMTKEGLEIRWGEDNKKSLSLEELEEAREEYQIKELLNSAVEGGC